MGTIVRGERKPFGPIVNNTANPGTTWQQVGGEGICLWKQLINGMHLEGNWNCVEYVVITPGSSVGEHVHMRTEEIYYIVSGYPVVTMDGVEIKAKPGDLITTPIGSAHTIRNDEEEDMHFFVIEVFPEDAPAAAPFTVSVPDLLSTQETYRGSSGSVRVSTVDLTPHFTGDWKIFSELEIPSATTIGEYELEDRTEVLFVLSGQVTITVNGVATSQGPNMCVAIPPKHPVTIENASGGEPARVISTEVVVK